MQDSELQQRLFEARGDTLRWLLTLQLEDKGTRVSRFSEHQDPALWPGMLLPGTYNSIMLSSLLGQAPDSSSSLLHWFESFRQADGRFRLPGMQDRDIFKKRYLPDTWEYIDFHIGNYTLGALHCLSPTYRAVLDFARPWCDTKRIDAWLSRRNWSDPWQEGNNIVNLGSFLYLLDRQQVSEARAALMHLIDRLEAIQNPATGFWDDRQHVGGDHLLHAFAGAMHSYHLWYLHDRPLPGQREALDYALDYPTQMTTACLDVDVVDVLFHAAPGHPQKREAIERWMREKLIALLLGQNADGGFADESQGELRFDGWINGYREPQGLSNTFATWFRWIALAMISEQLWPGLFDWQFRRMPGIGYSGRQSTVDHEVNADPGAASPADTHGLPLNTHQDTHG